MISAIHKYGFKKRNFVGLEHFKENKLVYSCQYNSIGERQKHDFFLNWYKNSKNENRQSNQPTIQPTKSTKRKPKQSTTY